jgi:hypothetical protein
MRHGLIALVLLLLACAPARAQEERRAEVQVGSIGISFALPAGFERMSAGEVAAQYARGVPPKAVFRDPRRELRVTVNTFDALDQGVGDLRSLTRRLKSDIEAAFPDARWVSRGAVKLGGVAWSRFRYRATAGIGPVVNDMYAVVWAGTAIIINFYGPAAEYGAARAAFEKSAASLRVSVSVIAPAGEG